METKLLFLGLMCYLIFSNMVLGMINVFIDLTNACISDWVWMFVIGGGRKRKILHHHLLGRGEFCTQHPQRLRTGGQ